MQTTTENKAMTARKNNRQAAHKAVPPHPEYNDELSREQVEAIRRLADPDGARAKKRVALYPSLV